MANLKNIKPTKKSLNLLHILEPVVESDPLVINAIVEINTHSLNKYELVTETGHLKLDRVGYSSLRYPFTYGAVPKTWDLDGDPLDIMIVNVTEQLIPGSFLEARVLGVVKFIDGGEVDDKIVAVINEDKRSDHIKAIENLGEFWQKETIYYWEHYKDLKKPGTGKVEGIFGVDEAKKVLDECIERYNTEYLPLLDNECCRCCDCGDGCECENCSC